MAPRSNFPKQRVPKASMHIFTRYLIVVLVIVSIYGFQNDVLFGAHPAFAQVYPRFVELPTQPIAIAANQMTDKLYIANYNNSITVLDTQTEKVLALISLGKYDQSEQGDPMVNLAVNEATNKIYATNHITDLVYIIDGRLDTISSTITLGQYEHGESVVANSLTNRIYVAGVDSRLFVIDGALDQITEIIDIGPHWAGSGHVSSLSPAMLTINPNTNLVYATNNGQDRVAVINGSTNKIIGNITMSAPFAAIINPDTNRLYVSYESSRDIKVFDGASLELVTTIDNAYAAKFRNAGIALNPELNLLYATRYADGEGDSIVIIDGKNYNSTEIKLDVPIRALGVNRATDRLYVAVEGSFGLYVIDDISFAQRQASSRSWFDLSAEKVNYSITGGEITNIAADEELSTLSFGVLTMEDGIFEIIFPRHFMTEFFKIVGDYRPHNDIEVFVDGEGLEANPLVAADCNVAIFRFPIKAGAETIEFIVGSVAADLPPSPAPGVFMFRHADTATNGVSYQFRVATNAGFCDISLVESEKRLQIGVGSIGEKRGFLKLTLPHYVLGGNYTVLIDGTPTNNYNSTFVPHGDPQYYLPEISSDATIISLEYDGSVNRSIDIIGTSVIPEFVTLPLILIATITLVGILGSRTYGQLRQPN